MTHLINSLEVEKATPTSMTNTRTFVQALGAISRQAGQRVGVGGYLDGIVPLIMHFVGSDGDDELKESCLQAFEALVIRCFREVTPHIPEVCGLAGCWHGWVWREALDLP